MNNECNKYQPKLEPFVDGTLGEEEAKRVSAHLEHCPACSAEVNAVRAIANTLSTLPYHTCPDHVIEAVYEATVRKQIPAESRGRKWDWSLIFGWRAAVAGMAAASIALLLLTHPFGDQNGAMPGYYHPDELAGAGELAKWSLLYVAQTMKESEREVVHDVVVEGLPGKIRGVVKNEIQAFKGVEL